MDIRRELSREDPSASQWRSTAPRGSSLGSLECVRHVGACAGSNISLVYYHIINSCPALTWCHRVIIQISMFFCFFLSECMYILIPKYCFGVFFGQGVGTAKFPPGRADRGRHRTRTPGLVCPFPLGSREHKSRAIPSATNPNSLPSPGLKTPDC